MTSEATVHLQIFSKQTMYMVKYIRVLSINTQNTFALSEQMEENDAGSSTTPTELYKVLSRHANLTDGHI
jgi:hypothetical protein